MRPVQRKNGILPFSIRNLHFATACRINQDKLRAQIGVPPSHGLPVRPENIKDPFYLKRNIPHSLYRDQMPSFIPPPGKLKHPRFLIIHSYPLLSFVMYNLQNLRQTNFSIPKHRCYLSEGGFQGQSAHYPLNLDFNITAPTIALPLAASRVTHTQR